MPLQSVRSRIFFQKRLWKKLLDGKEKEIKEKKEKRMIFENRVQREFRITTGIILGQLYIYIYIEYTYKYMYSI